ncbi:fatty acid desaturase family protein [Reichenbachiella versicolor]|uniref:fatty acid desaturase family protein n=1 Tax=Reichenbachiella versicolor TaxID=1821036 RepID=UPI000D6DF7EE|nr:acyl-CoA desaturase [Reichenbachiella versicolor]
MLTLFFAPLVSITIFPISSLPILFTLYILSGFGMAGIGIMHDAIHGSYSNNRTVNKLMSYTINLIGTNVEVWRLQHNVLHHSYTNVEEHDDDINAPRFLRFSPHSPKTKLHKYQHIYAWFFYGLTTLTWVTVKDFVKYKRYFRMGLIKDRKEYRKGLLRICLSKVLYYSIALIIPMIFSSFSIGAILGAFIVMHFVTGFVITLIFQIAHVTPDTSYPLPNEDGDMEYERLVHQLMTTCNFAPKSRWLSWFIGGLTNQIEHHLFPHISHVHYKDIAPIVRQTADEFNLPYYSCDTFISAVVQHFKMLHFLGKMETQYVYSKYD